MAALFFVVVTLAVRARNLPVATGVESLVGKVGEVRSALNPAGMVYVAGEMWSAVSEAGSVEAGTPVEVVGVNGLRLRVIPKK
jgi:membrane-bound serine protease (ClpP class)